MSLNSNNSTLIFAPNLADLEIRNGIRTGGNTGAIISKAGAGKIVFNGSENIMLNTFNILSGTAQFNSAKSTVGVLSITPLAMLDLRNNAPNEIFVIGAAQFNK